MRPGKERNREVWRAMEDMQAEGKIRSIGVSNFLPHHLDALLESANVLPAGQSDSLGPWSLSRGSSPLLP